MGISGLLPLLKSIQVNKHLSEFAGQTLAVDAYVWLHRGIFTCATELATGKKTTKYVDYAMHRVRLLRHHRIQPYIVFDGGPLPAKRGTEAERQQRRAENLARANALAAQGRHSQAREYYVKCVDVTPQMAYQLIKVLRAESIPYVVAPYEADAQLAYLERIGLADGIITEDSDLLVFGCRKVLFKLDDVTMTITCISRDDFSSVVPTASDTNSISLLGWSDKQFRHMAILSGCDYLPSIPGIGLKTAWMLLKKWRTPENVVKAVRLEGKKAVPDDYMSKFILAEQCFLHQRVYDPLQEKLVSLTDIGDIWDTEADRYIGEDLQPSIAKAISLGDVDPVTLLPMSDINPDFVPSGQIPGPLHTNDQNRKGKGKAKVIIAKNGGSILNFFGPKAIFPTTKSPTNSSSQPSINVKKDTTAGRASGKRTLADVMDQDISTKRKRRAASPTKLALSRFFGPSRATSSNSEPNYESLDDPGPSRLHEDKENIALDGHELDVEQTVGSDCDIPTTAQGEADADMELDLAEPTEPNVVEQEDGYISPTPSCSRDSQELSSPCVRRTLKHSHFSRQRSPSFEADILSSPPNRQDHCQQSTSPVKKNLPEITPATLCVSPAMEYAGPDLRTTFYGDQTSDIDYFDEDSGRDTSGTISPPSPSPPTPISADRLEVHIAEPIDLTDLEELDLQAHLARTEAVALGWREKWSLGVKSTLRRRETTVTPSGRHPPLLPRSQSTLSLHSTQNSLSSSKNRQARKSLVFVKEKKQGTRPMVDIHSVPGPAKFTSYRM